jgi:hypothetical protein
MRLLFAAIISTFLCTKSYATPDWAKRDTLKRERNALVAVCSGTGPSLDLSRRAALESCRQTAVDAVGSAVNTRSLSVETEHDTSFFSETSRNINVSNLDCHILREGSEEADGLFKDFVRCRYDLSRARVVNKNTADESKVIDDPENTSIVQNKNGIIKVQGSENNFSYDKPILLGENRQLILSVIPNVCFDVLIIGGEKPRSIKCQNAPLPLTIYPSDKELIIRDGSGTYRPKKIMLNMKRTPSSTPMAEELQVQLER